jgi:hypothetical protein
LEEEIPIHLVEDSQACLSTRAVVMMKNHGIDPDENHGIDPDENHGINPDEESWD